jgi:Ca2+-binding RTX toxin-like protein
MIMCIVCAQGLQSGSRGASSGSSFVGREGSDLSFAPPNHAGFEGPFSSLNADMRGGTGPNGRPSLTVTGAGNQLTRSNVSWDSGTGVPFGTATNVTFSFRSGAPTTMPDGTTGFTRFTEAQIAFTLLALQSWSDVANITFTRVGTGASGDAAYSDDATMVFGNYSAGAAGAAAFAFFPGSRASSSISGDLWFNSTDTNNLSGNVFEYGLLTMVHEIGHAIGLDHPAEYNAGEGAPTYTANATYYEDTYQYTLMSYFEETNTGANFVRAGTDTRIYPAAPMMDDIAAAQRLYGANMSTRTGDTVYGFNSTADRAWFSISSAARDVVFAVWDAGGIDTFNFSGYSQNQLIDLRGGNFSNVGGLVGNVSIALGATIENAIGGAGADRLIGNAAANRLTGGAGDDVIDGGAGTDIAIFAATSAQVTFSYANGTIIVDGPDGRDVLTGIERLQFSDRILDVGADGRVITTPLNVISGTSGADSLVGTAAGDAISGGTGNDILRGNGGSDTLDGGDGFDVAVYAGVRRQYGASINSVAGGPEGGTDTLVSIEELRFVDGALSFDVNGIAAQVMRLYDATLDRQPDQAGLDVQIRALASGATTLQALANAFVASAEFQSRYGALSNQQFVEQLYRFSLDREGDAAGIALQVNALNTGTSRAALVVGFSESAEHRLLTQPILNAGLWVASDKALQIARLYDATFDRLPDAAGLAAQIAALDSGVSLLTIAAGFAASAEFQARYGALSNQAFVEQLYRFCLNREGDAAGIALQVNALNTGTSRAQLLLGFSESAEHVSLTAPFFSGGIRTVDPAFSGAPVEADVGGKPDDQPQTLVPADDAMTLDTGPQVLIPADDASAKGQGFDVAQTHPGLVLYDPADIVIDFKPIDDAFVLPGLDDLSPLVLPDVEAIDRDLLAIDLVGMVPTGDTMLILAAEDGWSAEAAAHWQRSPHHDGWMMQ